MNQLKHICGIPMTLPNGLALRGTTFSRSAGTGGRNSKRSGRVLVARGDNDDSEPKLSSRSYAKLIDDYSKAIDVRNVASKLTEDHESSGYNGFFTKTRFRSLARVSSLVNIKSVGNTVGSSVSTNNSLKCSSDSNKTNDKTDKSKGNAEASNQISKRTEWLEHVLRAPNTRRMSKNDSSSRDLDQEKNLAHSLVQRLPESRATSKKIIPKCTNDSVSAVKKMPDTSTSPMNEISKISKTENTISKRNSDTSVHRSSFMKKVLDCTASDEKKKSKPSKTEDTSFKSISGTSVHRGSPVKKLPGNSASDPNIVSSKKSETGYFYPNNFSSPRERYCSSIKKVTVTSASPVKKVTDTSASSPVKKLSDTSANLSVKKILDTSANFPVKKLLDTSANSPVKKLSNNSAANSPVKKISDTSANVSVKKLSDTSANFPVKKLLKTSANLPVKKLSDTSANSPVKKLSDSSANVSVKKLWDTSANFPVKKLLKTSANLPVKKLSDTSANSPVKKLSDTSANVSVKKLWDTSANFPVKKLLKTSANLPVKKLSDTSANSPVKKLSDTSVNVSVKKLSDTSTNFPTKKLLDTSANSPVKKLSNTSAANSPVKKLSDNSANVSVKKLSDTSANFPVKKLLDTSTNFPVKKLLDTSAANSPVKKLSDPSANVSAKKGADTSENSPVKKISETSVNSRVKKVWNTSSDANFVSNESSKTGNLNPQNGSDSSESYHSSGKKVADTSNNANNVSVVVQRLGKPDKARKELSTENSGDNNTMLVTVTEESRSSSSSQSSPLRHVDLRVNGKPATKVDTVISKVDKLGVVSSADKIEITIPVLSKPEGAVADNVGAQNSTINLCISSQGKQSKGSNDVGCKARKVVDIGNSKPRLKHPSTHISSKNRNTMMTEACRSKIVPWWTTVESFRRSESVARSTKSVTTIGKAETKSSGIGKSLTRGNREAHQRTAKDAAVSNAGKAVKFIVTKPSSPRHHQYRKSRTSVVSKIIANASQRKSERDEKERQIREKVALERSKRIEAKPPAKADTKVRSTASNEPKRESSPVAIGSTMPGKSDQTTTPTLDEASKKMASTLESTVAAPVVKSMTAGLDSSKGINGNDNLSNANNVQGRIRAKPIPETSRGNTNAGRGGTISIKAESKIGTKPPQDATSKSETKAAPQLPRTYGTIRVLQSSAKPAVNRENNNRCLLVKPSDRTAITDDKLLMSRNATISMRPMEKKRDRTLIDYGLTANTRKKPERKLSESETDGLQGKKPVRQKEGVVVATVKEVMPRRNRDTRSSTIDPRSAMDGPEKSGHRTTNETRVSPSMPKNTVPKGTTNEPNESTNPRTSVKAEKRNAKASNESQIVEPASADKKLVYSVWLRRFKERKDEDSDPTTDPSTRNS